MSRSILIRMAWDPAQYQKFKEQRAQPFFDLLKLVRVREGLSVVDLGCGTGELTARLADKLPGSDVLGIDSSTEMLQKAATHARPGLRFQQASIEEVRGEWDLVFSNAALHWVPDHQALFLRLLRMVRPGGQLLVQMPSNVGHRSHLILRELSWNELRWSYDWPVLSIDAYGELLWRAGGRDLVVLEKLYCHELPSSDEIAEWLRGTSMLPYFERLPPDGREPFFARYRERLREQWPEGPVFFGFRRILIGATKET